MIQNTEVHAVTGAFGYSGKYISRRLLKEGIKVRTLTNSPERSNEFKGKIQAFPFSFEKPEKLCEYLKGVKVLYNTYWVRFNHRDFKYSIAKDNTLTLFNTAKKAGVKRVVHISITNPSINSNLEYFRYKAELENALIESGMTYAILRPAVLFGKEDILINNIAWILRRFPFFAVFGNGNYRMQPIYVDDLAMIAVEQGKQQENNIINAIGPEVFTYRDLVHKIGIIIGEKRPIISLPDSICYFIGNIVGMMMKDVVVTYDEIEGLKADLLYSDDVPAGHTKLTDWAEKNAESLGIRYANELARRRNRIESYDKL